MSGIQNNQDPQITKQQINKRIENQNISADSDDKEHQAQPLSSSKCATFRQYLKLHKKKFIVAISVFFMLAVLGITLGLLLSNYGETEVMDMNQTETIYLNYLSDANGNSLVSKNQNLGSGLDLSRKTQHFLKDKITTEVTELKLETNIRACPEGYQQKENSECYLVRVPTDLLFNYVSEELRMSLNQFFIVYNSDPGAFWHHLWSHIKNKLASYSELAHNHRQYRKLDYVQVGEIRRVEYLHVLFNQTTNSLQIETFEDSTQPQQEAQNVTEASGDEKLQLPQLKDTHHQEQNQELARLAEQDRKRQNEEDSASQALNSHGLISDGRDFYIQYAVPLTHQQKMNKLFHILKKSLNELRTLICKHLKDIKERSEQNEEKTKQWAEGEMPEWAESLVEHCYSQSISHIFYCRMNEIDKVIPSADKDSLPEDVVITQILEITIYVEQEQ